MHLIKKWDLICGNELSFMAGLGYASIVTGHLKWYYKFQNMTSDIELHFKMDYFHLNSNALMRSRGYL